MEPAAIGAGAVAGGGAPSAPDLRANARELIAWLSAQAALEQNPQRLGRLHLEWAQLLEFPEGDFSAARNHYQKAHELLPTHEAVAAGLARVSLLLEDYVTALRFLDEQVKLTRLPADKAQRLLALGLLLEDKLRRPAEARRAYEQALELSPQDPSILRALARRLRADGDFDALDPVLARQAEVAAADPFLRAARVARRARVVEVRRNEPELAAELFELAFQAAPDASAALFHLERLHGQDGQYVALAQALTRKASLLTDAQVRSTGLERRAYIELDRLGQTDAGLASLEQAAESAPFDRDLLRRLLEQYSRSGQAERALGALARLDQLLTDPREQASLRVKAARIAENELKDLRQAVLWYERAREAQPGSPAVVLPLLRLYRQVGAFPQLIEVLLGEERVTTDLEKRATLLAEVAELYETRLGSVADARQFHARALAVWPSYGPSERALIRLYSDARMTPELIELLERAADNAPTDEVRERHQLKVATLYEDWLGEHEKALQTYRRILQRNPAHGGALLGAQNAAERAGNPAALVELLEAEASLTVDVNRKAALLSRAGDTARDRLGDSSRAQALYEQVLGLDPRSKVAFSGLSRLFELTGRFEDLVELRKKAVELAQDGKERAQILYEMADVAESQLGAPERAVGYLKRAVGADPEHQAARERLSNLLGHTQQHEELLRQLVEDAARSADAEIRAGLELRRARLLENVLDRPPEALDAYERALKESPQLRSAQEGRLRLLRTTGQVEAFARELASDAAAVAEPRLALWEGLASGEVVLDELNQGARAAEQLGALLTRFPSHPLGLLLLEEAYSMLGDRAGLVRVLEDQLQHFAGVEQLGALSELVRVAPGERVRSYLMAILERQPRHTQALEALERFALGSFDLATLAETEARLAESSTQKELSAQHWVRLGALREAQEPERALRAYRSALELDADSVAAARGISRIAEALFDPELLVEAAQTETRVTRDRARASGLMVKAAQVLDQRGRTGEAVNLLERGLEIDPNDRISADALAYFLGRSGDGTRLARTLSAAAQAATEPLSISHHWSIAARVYEEQLGDRGAALAALGRVEKLVPDDVVALRALGELYLRDRQFGPAAERLERAWAGLRDPEQQLEVELALSQLYTEHLNRKDEAERMLNDVLRRHPDERRALRWYYQILSERRDPRAHEVARRWAEASEGLERTEALTALGRLLRERGNASESKEVFLQALPSAGAGGVLTDLLSLLANAEPGDLERVVAGLEAHSRSPGFAVPERAESAFQAGRLLLDRLGQLPRARQSLELCLELEPRHLAARSHLVSCLERSGDLTGSVLQAQLLVEFDSARPDSWLQLRRAFELSGRAFEAELTHGPLVWLGAAGDSERASWTARQPRSARVVAGSAREGLTALLEPIAEQGGETLWLINELSGLGPKVFPGGLELLGLSPRDRVTARMQHPLRPILDRVLKAFGAPELDLYPVVGRVVSPRLVIADSLGVVVPTSFAELREAQQVYLLAELVAGVALGVPLLFVLSEADVQKTIVAACRFVEPTFQMPGVTVGLELDELTRRISKAPSWLAKGKFSDRVRRYLGQPGPDVLNLVRSVQRSARAIALLLADDLSPLELLRDPSFQRERAQSTELEGIERELLASWMSVRASRARTQMGL